MSGRAHSILHWTFYIIFAVGVYADTQSWYAVFFVLIVCNDIWCIRQLQNQHQKNICTTSKSVCCLLRADPTAAENEAE